MWDRVHKERMKGLHSLPEKQKIVGRNRHNSILPTPEKLLWEHSDQFFFMSTEHEEICLPRSKKNIDFQKQFLEAGGEDDCKLAPM